MSTAAQAADTVPGEVLVRYEGSSVATIKHVSDTDKALNALNRSDDVVFAEPVYVTHAQAVPANSGFGEQWHLRDATQIARAWNLTGAGSSSVLVANVDSGVNVANPGLASTPLWTNTAEIAGNGLDDDGDGCVDDVHGCDFVDQAATRPTTTATAPPPPASSPRAGARVSATRVSRRARR